MTRPGTLFAVFKRCHEPGLPGQIDHVRRKRRRAGIPGSQFVEGAGQITDKAGRIDLEMAKDGGEIAVVLLQQLDQPVLYLNVVMGARKTHTRRRLQRAPADVVHLVD